jgi:EAL domain-containing protein (putative c-di-GMP-specific phosphodiesterase class I)
MIPEEGAEPGAGTGAGPALRKGRPGSRLDVVEALLHAARGHLGARTIFLSEVFAGREVISAADGDERLIEGIMPEGGVSRPGEERLFAVGPFVLDGGWVGMPVVLHHGQPFGTLWMLPARPAAAVQPGDARYLRAFARLLSEHLDVRPRRLRPVPDGDRKQVRRLVRGQGLTMLGQPIVELEGGKVRGYESLARFDGHPDLTPPHWFAVAAKVGLGVELEMTAVRRGLAQLEAVAPGLYISVNVSPEAAASRQLRRVLEGVDLDRVVLEITEHASIDSYTALNRALLPLRIAGAMVAIDDAGAGFASFRHILHIHPDIIKLDATWVIDVEADVVRRKLISALVSFARDIGSTVVAEAVETDAQYRTLIELGVECGQGFHLGRPGLLVAAAVEVEPGLSLGDDYSH